VPACNRRHCHCRRTSSSSFRSCKESLIIRGEINFICVYTLLITDSLHAQYTLATRAAVTMVDGAIHISHCNTLSLRYFLIFLIFSPFSLFLKMKVGLCDLHAVCVFVCMYPPISTSQWLDQSL
jgi:hypothetical protein